MDWLWFVVSQMGFGIVAGIVVSRQERIRTWQHLPFAMRAGMEVQGPVSQTSDEKNRGPAAMRPAPFSRALAVCMALGLAACSNSPGRPRPNSEVIPSSKIMDFKTLYGQN